MEIIFFILIVVYAVFILQLFFGFNKIKDQSISKEYTPKTNFTIVVPFRNEAKNLSKLLASLSNLNYPKNFIEIIMIDDDSKDNSSAVFIKWRMKNDEIDTTLLENLRLSNSPKKDAISRAMPIAKNPWIITTDADCEVNPNWLSSIDGFIQKNSFEMIAAPVIYKTKNNWFHHFQQFEMLSLQATTIGSFGINQPFMCNGANFAYTKKMFLELDGFEDNNKIASGDDVFLLQKAIAKCSDKVGFLKAQNAIVITKPENNLFKLLMHRIRWASKTSNYNSFYPKFLASSVFFANAFIAFGLIALFFGKLDWKLFLILFLIKYSIDYLLILKANSFFNTNKIAIPFASAILYPFFATTVGVFSLFGKFTWKGRRF
ncbi:MAG TPA: glycosyltransferase [Flavobacterium sp.]|uniref:glycosyltransferase n=1 Tax=Flavobacterium sp. TaxID=239 RepID=UPI002B6986C3|nr:glycosyltransferase [Flavobacterium sp.]HPW98228.1 glycosyltransferase [Flavobacterium sp.]HQA74549.1 glycosyltransferase [Flavobacterium sp.]